MAMQPTRPDWGSLLKAEAFECSRKGGLGCEGFRQTAGLCLVAQVLNLLNKQVVVVSTVAAALPPPALVALPSPRLKRRRGFLRFLITYLAQINLYHLVSLLSLLLY